MAPPYADASLAKSAERLATSHLVSEESTLVIEHSRRVLLEGRYGDFCQIKTLRHGDSHVSVYQFAGYAS